MKAVEGGFVGLAIVFYAAVPLFVCAALLTAFLHYFAGWNPYFCGAIVFAVYASLIGTALIKRRRALRAMSPGETPAPSRTTTAN